MKARLLIVSSLALGALSLSLGAERTESTTRPTDIRRGVDMSVPREERAKHFYENAIRKVEPSLVGMPERLPQYVDLFKREFVEDPRTFAFDVKATKTGDAVAVSGWVEFDEHRKALGQFLGYLGFSKVNEEALENVPGPAMCETAYAIVGNSPCFVYDKPAGQRENLTQALPGDGLFLLRDNHDGTFLCHAADGYVGYVEAAKVRRVDGDAFDKHLQSRPRSADADTRIETAIAAAMKLQGTKYVWGGRTPDGIDCSGLVHTAFRAAGVNLPRDADQQSLVGTLVATRWHTSSLRRGDVLFFLGKRGTVSHTGIYLGDGKFIEATDPVVKITPLDEIPAGKDRARDETLCFGKRVLE
jgi:cell wall-associated NlpC family hydrolase